MKRRSFLAIFCAGVSQNLTHSKEGSSYIDEIVLNLSSITPERADQAALGLLMHGKVVLEALRPSASSENRYSGRMFFNMLDSDPVGDVSVGYVARYIIYSICTAEHKVGQSVRFVDLVNRPTDGGAASYYKVDQKRAGDIYREWWEQYRDKPEQWSGLSEFLKSKGVGWRN